MPATTSVRDIMTADVVSLRADQTVAQAADALAERNVGAMPVVDADGKLLGLLRDEDLIVTEARVHAPTMLYILGAVIPLPGQMHQTEEELRKLVASDVGHVMDDDPATIGPDDSVEDLATLMYDKHVTHVPVVDAGGKVVGIVARGDLVRLIARTT